jgi:hypothetical protein
MSECGFSTVSHSRARDSDYRPCAHR